MIEKSTLSAVESKKGSPTESMAPMYTPEKMERHDAFFNALIQELGIEKADGDIVAVLHLLPDVIPFTKALGQVADISAIVPKQRSINERSVAELKDLPLHSVVTRENCEVLARDLKRPTVFMDIGGYFAGVASEIQKREGENFAGVVEDTENGLQKYIKAGIDFPFVSVARSPLKQNEDVMVGQAIAHSAESILRHHGVVFNGMNVGVIGYGKIGESVARNVQKKEGNVLVYDTGNIRATHAVSAGFNVAAKEEMLGKSDAVCLATGNLSLSGDDYTLLKNGAWVFAVTSSDDEMNKDWLDANYSKEQISEYATKYSNNEGHYFYLLNEGNAINFVGGSTVGDFILLVHAELLVAVHQLLERDTGVHSQEVDESTREKIAEIWLRIFRK